MSRRFCKPLTFTGDADRDTQTDGRWLRADAGSDWIQLQATQITPLWVAEREHCGASFLAQIGGYARGLPSASRLRSVIRVSAKRARART
jgi:ABC-type lipopolysaccharide export system ATPase subunit